MATARMTNEQISAQEVEDFKRDAPEQYFAYFDHRKRWSQPQVEPVLVPGDRITTWTGDELCRIVHAGRDFLSNVGDRRQNFRARAINGATYSGTAYLSAGDYVRMRKVKAA